MAADILKIGARGGGVTLMGQLIKILLQFGSVIVLSRLLSPSDFGLIAMVTVFVSLGELIRDFGLPTAALQAPKLSRAQASNMFWMNSALGLILGAVLVAATPLIVLIYSEQTLSTIVPIMALVIVLNGLQAQVQVQMARALRFGTLVVTDISAQVIGLITAITLAASGFGVWALVAQAIASAGSLLIIRMAIGRWIPGLPRRGAQTRPLVKNAAHFGFSQALTFGASNADTVVVGSQFDASALGFYNRAFQLLTVPLSRTLAPLTRIAIPAMNRARSEGHDYFAVLLRVQSTMAIVLVWVFAVAGSAAPVLLPALLGEEWRPSVLIFQILAIGGSFQVFSYVSYWGFLLAGDPKQLVLYNLVTKPLTVVFVILGSFFGLAGVAIGYALGLIVAWPINMLWLRRSAGQPIRPFLANGLRSIAAGALAATGGLIVVRLTEASPLIAIICSIATSTLIYAAALLSVSSGRRELTQLWKLFLTLTRRGAR